MGYTLDFCALHAEQASDIFVRLAGLTSGRLVSPGGYGASGLGGF